MLKNLTRHCSSIFILAMLVAGCTLDGRKSSRGFRLPDGDPAAGRKAFLELRCNHCHGVVGEAFEPVAVPAVPVRLGGQIASRKTDGDLLTSIVHPSHSIRFKGMSNDVERGGTSRMGDYSEAMTVRQLVDLVAYLHTKYKTPTPSGP